MTEFNSFTMAIKWAQNKLMHYGRDVDPGSWQGYKTEGKPDLVTREFLNLQFEVPITNDLDILKAEIKPNLPWADDHFEERVSRIPSNPGDEWKSWPWWRGQDAAARIEGGLFDHTYQERFWPKYAGDPNFIPRARRGIRYPYGDLDSVVDLLLHNPYTRQATFPIFFPEDTGAVFGGRTPCTLHYHFMLREDELHMWYPIRSCDLVRHFRDDLYMACRLLLWVLEECRSRVDEDTDRDDFSWFNVAPGMLYFTAYSFHVHHGDMHHVRTS